MQSQSGSILTVGMADIKAGQAPAVIRTTLGSCIGVCLYEPCSKSGAMLHLMMASSAGHENLAGFRAEKFADTGIPVLLSHMKRICGAEPGSLKAKLFGGADQFGASTVVKIGADNASAVTRILGEYRIPIIAKKLGGPKGYQIEFDLNTGKVVCKVFGQTPEEY